MPWNRRGFTRTELLVMIAIIAVLIALRCYRNARLRDFVFFS
jgi:Tfp pilus assembly protein PilE